MPKTNPNPHPVAVARKALGWTQASLAERCGCATVTIKKIEGRTLRPSTSLASRIMWVTGLTPNCVIDGTAAEYAGMTPYTPELGRVHVEAMKTTSKTGGAMIDRVVEELIGEFREVFMAMMAAAVFRNALRPVGHMFMEWAVSTIDGFQLEPLIRTAPSAQGSQLEKLQKLSRRKRKSKG